jgi:hypothetical protein
MSQGNLSRTIAKYSDPYHNLSRGFLEFEEVLSVSTAVPIVGLLMTVVKLGIHILMIIGILFGYPASWIMYKVGNCDDWRGWVLPVLRIATLHILYCLVNIMTLTGFAFYYEIIQK